MDIIVAQMRVYAGQIEKNLANILKLMEDHKDADMLVFPNMALTSYLPARMFEESSFQKRLEKAHREIIENSGDLLVVWGSVEGKSNYIYLASKGHVQMISQSHRHQFSDLYAKENSQNIFELHGKRYAFYLFDESIQRSDADHHIILANDPWRKHRVMKRRSFLSKIFDEYLFVNALSLQNFTKSVYLADGRSVYYEKEQFKVLAAYKEVSTPMNSSLWERKNDLLEVDDILDHLIYLIRFFDEEALGFYPNWVVGLSGGLDSSVSYALLNLALGKERVIAVTMPSQYNQEKSRNNASYMAEVFASDLLVLPIENLVNETIETLKLEKIDVSEGLAHENIQARLRGHLLMSVASVRNGVVVNNGNKIETAMGYATLYGDAIGALSPLADLSKIEVGILGESINKRLDKEVVPKNLLPQIYADKIKWDFAPTAELREEQLDPMKWGYHDLLLEYLMRFSKEAIIAAYDQGDLEKTALGQYLSFYGLDDRKAFLEDLEWFDNQVRKASFKRIQIPPVAVLSDLPFGREWEEWQGNKKA